MVRTKKAILAAAAAAVTQFSLAQFSQGATFTWDGGGTNDNLSTGANWVGDVTPAPADLAIFTGAVRTTPIVDVPTQYIGVTFDALASAFTLGGTSTLTLGASPSGAGTITNNSAVVQTFNAPVAMYAGTINAATGGLVFNGMVDIGVGGLVGANALTVRGAGPVTFSGGLTSAIAAGSTVFGVGTGGGSIATYTGAMFINGSNPTLVGNVSISGGTVQINNGSGLGGSGTIFMSAAIAGGGTGFGVLELTGDITVSKNVQMNGRGDTSVPHVRNVSGTNVIQNLHGTSGGAFHNIESAAGTLIINNYNHLAAVPSARTIGLLGAGYGQIDAWTPTTHSHNVLKSGTGTWRFGPGVAGNGSFGNVTVNAGTLQYGGGSGARVFGNTTITTGGTLVVESPDGTSGEIGNGTVATTIAINAGGALRTPGFTDYSLQPNQILLGGGTFQGTRLSVYGDNVVRIGNTAAAAAGTFNVVGNLSLSNQFATAAGAIYFDLSNTTTVGGGVNDLISIQGDLQIDNSGGPIEISVNPLSTSYASGTYRLFEFTSGNTLNASDFSLLGFTASRQTGTITTAAGQVNLLVTGSAANLVWKGDGSGNVWDVGVTSNWLNGVTPDKFFQGDNVTLDNSTANTTLNLNEGAQPGTITVNNDASHNYVIQGSGTLLTGALTKSGAGALTIANVGTNSLSGAITISGGTLQVGAGGADGSLGGATITNNANLVVDKSGGLTLGNVIEGTGQLIKRGSGALALTGNNTYTGATVVEAGVLQYNVSGALGDAVAGTTVASGAQLFSTANTTTSEPLNLVGDGPVAGDGALRVGGATTSTFNGAIVLSGATTLKVDGGATMVIAGGITGTNTDLTLNGDSGGNGVISSAMALGTGGITKNGAGQWTLANPSITYSGATAINAGVLQYGNGTVTGDAPLPTAPITLTGGTIAFNNTGSYVVSANISGTGGIAVGNGGGTVTLTGNLTGFTGLLTTLNGGTNSMLVVPSATGATAVQILDTNLLGNGQGIIRLTNSNAVASGVATLDIQTSQTGGTGRLEVGNSANLNFGSIILHPRNNATATIRATDGNNSIAGPIRINTGGTFVTIEAGAGASLTMTGPIRPAQTGEGDVPGSSRGLVFGGDGDGTFSGSITNRPDAATTVGILVYKRGAGTWRLTGTNDYIGAATNAALPANAATIVEAGKLVLVGAGAHAPVFSNANANAYTDIQGGRLVFEGGSGVAAQVLSILDAGYDLDPKFSAGLIRSTTIVPGVGLGWKEDTGAQQVTVGRTYYGDTNLDGQVDITDLAALATSWQTAGVWANGDSDYSGFIDITDLAALATNWQAGVGAPLAMTFEQALASVGLGGVAVPEPTSLGVLALTGLLARRRRH